MRVLSTVIAVLIMVCGLAAKADYSQSELRPKFLQLAQRDFLAHYKNSGLERLGPQLSSIEQNIKVQIEARANVKLTRLETKLLVRHPQQIPRVRFVKNFAYSLTGQICRDEEAEGNETDAARHFVAAFALSLLSGEKFAYQYLTAHESWIVDEDLNQFSGYNFASTVMDFHNNTQGLLAAREYRKSFSIAGLTLELRTYTPHEVRSLALEALKKARSANKLVAASSKTGACSQVSEDRKFHEVIGLPQQQLLE